MTGLLIFIMLEFAVIGAWIIYCKIASWLRHVKKDNEPSFHDERLSQVADQLDLMKQLIEVLHDGICTIYVNKNTVNCSLIAQETLEEFKRLAQKGEQNAEALYTAHYRS